MNQLNRYWRVVATGFSFCLFGLGGFIIGAAFLLVKPLPFSTQRKRRWIRRIISRCCTFYIQIMRAMGLLTYSFEMNTPLPAGALIIANHPTLLDAIFILAYYDNLCCIMKSALWQHPATASAARLAGYISNDSENFIEEAVTNVSNGENLLIFPEGTRNQTDVDPSFKRGAANIALSAACPILPIIIRCEPRTLQKGEKWYQVPATKPHFSFATDNLLYPEHHVPTDKPRTVRYRRLTHHLEQYYHQVFAQNLH